MQTRVIIQIVVLDKVELEENLVDTFKAIQNLVASSVIHNLAFAASHIPFTLVVSHSFAAFMAVHILVALVVTHILVALVVTHILVALVVTHNLAKP